MSRFDELMALAEQATEKNRGTTQPTSQQPAQQPAQQQAAGGSNSTFDYLMAQAEDANKRQTQQQGASLEVSSHAEPSGTTHESAAGVPWVSKDPADAKEPAANESAAGENYVSTGLEIIDGQEVEGKRSAPMNFDLSDLLDISMPWRLGAQTGEAPSPASPSVAVPAQVDVDALTRQRDAAQAELDPLLEAAEKMETVPPMMQMDINRRQEQIDGYNQQLAAAGIETEAPAKTREELKAEVDTLSGELARLAPGLRSGKVTQEEYDAKKAELDAAKKAYAATERSMTVGEHLESAGTAAMTGLERAGLDVTNALDWLLGENSAPWWFLNELATLASGQESPLSGLNPITNLKNRGEQEVQWWANQAAEGAEGNTAAEFISQHTQSIAQTLPFVLLNVMSAGTAGTAAAGTTAGLEYTAALNASPGMQAVSTMASKAMADLATNPTAQYSFVSTFGGSYDEALQDGASPTEASIYAMLNATFGTIVEMSEGGMEGLPDKVVDALKTGKRGIVLDWAKSIVGEVGEEELQGLLERGLGTFYNDAPWFSLDDPDAVINPGVMWQTAKDTAIDTAILGAGQTALQRGMQRAGEIALSRAEAAREAAAQQAEAGQAAAPATAAAEEAAVGDPEHIGERFFAGEFAGEETAPQTDAAQTLEEESAETAAEEASAETAEDAAETPEETAERAAFEEVFKPFQTESGTEEAEVRVEGAEESTGTEAADRAETGTETAARTATETNTEAEKAANRTATMQGILERTARKTATDIPAADMQALAEGYETGTKGSTYASAAVEAYRMGTTGTESAESARSNSKYGTRISLDQFRRAYELGQEAASRTTADISTDEGKQTVKAALASLGRYAGEAATVYESTQDVNRFAAGMSEAAERFAATGEDLTKKAAPSGSMISVLSEAQIRKAQEIGGKLRSQREAAMQKVAEQRRAIRQQAKLLNGESDLAEVNRAIREANRAGREAQKLFEKQRAALEFRTENDETFTEEEYNRLYDEAKENLDKVEALADEVERLEAKRDALEQKAAPRKKGTVSLDGGSIDGTSYAGVDQNSITRQQKNVVAMVERLADLVNIDYVIFSGPANMGGAYLSGGRVFININAGMTQAGRKSIAAASLSHELTHFMQDYAPEEYQQLKDYVIKSVLKKSSAEFDRLVEQQRRWEPGKSYDELVDELVANACQSMLTDDRAVQKMARSNMTLAQRVADVLDDITERIRKAFEGLSFDENRALYAPVKAVMDEIDGIAERWADGISAAVENYNAEQTVRGTTVFADDNGGNKVRNQTWDEADQDEQRVVEGAQFSARAIKISSQELQTDINNAGLNLKSKDNNKNNQRIRSYIEEHYPGLAERVVFSNDKNSGTVKIDRIFSQEEMEAIRSQKAQLFENQKRRDRFWERYHTQAGVKRLEGQISKMLERFGFDAVVEHSHSMVGSLSFYVRAADGTTIKVSDHNTVRQAREHADAAFIDLREIESLEELYTRIQNYLSSGNSVTQYSARTDGVDIIKQFQVWDDTTEDTAAEREGRNVAYARLQNENAVLRETVDAMRKLSTKQGKTIEALQKRMQLTKTPEVRQSDAAKLARQLIREHGSTAETADVAAQIKAVGDYLLQTPTAEIREDELKNRARAAARQIVETAQETVDADNEALREIAGRIKGRKLSIDADYTGEMDGGFDAFRRSLFGSLTLAQRESNTAESREGYQTVDQFYTDLQNEFGKGYFPDVANEGEQAQVLAQMLDAGKPMTVNPYEQYIGEATEEMANRIVMDAMNGVLRQTAPTTADRQKARTQAMREQINQLKAENKLEQREAASLYHTIYDLSVALDQAESRYQTLQAKSNYRAEQIRSEGRARAIEIRAKEKAAKWERVEQEAAKYQERLNRKDAKIREQRERVSEVRKYYQDMAKRARQSRNDTTKRRKIRKLIDGLNNRLAHPTEYKHIPKELTRLTIDILEMIDTGGIRSGKAFAEKMNKLRRMYDSYKEGDYSAIYDPVTAEAMKNVADMLSTSFGSATEEAGEIARPAAKLQSMTTEQLDLVYRMLRSLTHVVDNAVKVKIGNEERSAFEMSKEMTRETREVPKAQKGWIREHAIPAHLRADVAFDRFGGFKKNSAWMQAARMLNDGQMKQTRLKMELSLPFAELFNNEKALRDYTGMNSLGKLAKGKLVDVGLRDQNGNAIPITHDFMVALYMDLTNEDNRRHFIRGGKTVPDFQSFYDGTGGFGMGSRRAPGISSKLAGLYHELNEAKRAEDVTAKERAAEIQADIDAMESEGERYASEVQGKIERAMTDYDKAWLAAMRQLFDVDSKRELNQTTMDVYGIEKASVPNYFPIFTDKDFIAAPMETITRDASLENAGFMKERVKSGNPTNAVGSVWAVTQQIDRVSEYCGLMPAIRNFSKVYGKTQSGYEDSLKKALDETFGKTGTDYVENLIADLNGNRGSGTDVLGIDKLLGKLRGNLARATLTLRPRVALAQAASYPTAAAELGWKPLHKALFKGGRSGRMISRADTELIGKYSPLLWLRMQGYSTPELGDIQDSNRLEDRVWRKLRFATGWIQAVDGATVGRLWYAAEYWVQEHKPSLEQGTEAYYEAVAEKFNDVVEKTQPNYTTMQRAAILRDPSSVTKLFTMFLTQRLQNANILYDAAGRYQKARADFKAGRNGVTKADVAEARRTMGLAVSSQIVQAALFVGMKFFTDALMHAFKKYRDKETGDLTAESVSLSLIDAFCDTLLGNVLFASDIYSLGKALTGHGKWYGISVSGLDQLNDLIDSIVNLASYKVDWDDEKSRRAFYKKLLTLGTSYATANGYPVNNAIEIGQAVYYHIEDAANGRFGSFEAGFERTKAQNTAKLIQALENGDSDAIAAATEVFDSEKDALAAVKEQLKNEFGNGKRDREAVEKLLEKAGMEEDDIWLTIHGWETGDGSAVYNAAKRAAFADDRSTYKAEVAGLTEHGKTESAVQKEVKDLCKDVYFGNELSEKEQEIIGDRTFSKGELRSILVNYGGMDRDTADETLAQWQKDKSFQDRYGFAWSERRDQFYSGSISRKKAIRIIMDYDGVTEEEAAEEIEVWEWSRDVPNAESISKEAVQKYNEFCEAAGVSKADYVSAWRTFNSTKADKDENGETIRNSRMFKLFDYISGLPLTAEQKTALALTEYSAKNVKKYKTW